MDVSGWRESGGVTLFPIFIPVANGNHDDISGSHVRISDAIKKNLRGDLFVEYVNQKTDVTAGEESEDNYGYWNRVEYVNQKTDFCFKCCRNRHNKASDCTSEEGGVHGHFARNCPTLINGLCYKCFKDDHLASPIIDHP